MHNQFDNNFNAIEFGARFTELAKTGVDGVGNARPTYSSHQQAVQAEEVTKAVSNGRISKDERTTFSGDANNEILVKQRTSLQDAVRTANGAKDKSTGDKASEGSKRDANDDVKSDHDKRVENLAKGQTLEDIDASIKSLGDSPGVATAKLARETRVAEETKVVDVIEDKTALVGVLTAQRVNIEERLPANARDDFQALRTEASAALEQFNLYGGQKYEGGTFGDDWNTTHDLDFDSMVKSFSGEDGEDKDFIDNWAAHQGDGNDGRNPEQMANYIADLREKGDKYTVKVKDAQGNEIEQEIYKADAIQLRYDAANTLADIMSRADGYLAAKEAADSAKDSFEQIDGQVASLNESIATDKTALSAETLAALDKSNGTDVAPAPSTVDTEHERPKYRPTTPTSTGSTNKGAPSTPSPGSPSDRDEAEAAEQAATPTSTGSTNKGAPSTPSTTTPTQTNPPAETTTPPTVTREVTIDYNTPEQRTNVLWAATAGGFIPANTVFNEGGEAVYTVQPNDSYWRIADQASPAAFEAPLFQAMIDTNSQRLQRGAHPTLIHPSEQLILPGRSIADLVALMNMPLTQTVDVTEEAALSGGGGGGHTTVR